MEPLSVLKYYINNKRKFVSVFSAITLSVFLLYIIQMLIDCTLRTTYCVFVEPQKYYSSITAKARLLDDGLVKSIEEHSSVEHVIPWVFHYTDFKVNIGGNTGVKLYTVRCSDMELIMSRLSLRLKEGRLPAPGTNEIAVHYLLAANKGLKTGDKLGSDIDRDEAIQGERVLVGLIEGSSIAALESLEYWSEKNEIPDPNKYGIMIFPKKGEMKNLNKYLDSLNLLGMELRTFESVSAQNARETESIDLLLTFINIFVIAIVSVCVGFLCYIYFTQRRSEFGLLSAIGYSRQQVVNRAFAEIGALNAAGYITALLLCIVTGAILNSLVFIPKGQMLKLFSPDYALKTLCIPVFVTLFSIIPVWRMLKKLDPISIIEGMV